MEVEEKQNNEISLFSYIKGYVREAAEICVLQSSFSVLRNLRDIRGIAITQ